MNDLLDLKDAASAALPATVFLDAWGKPWLHSPGGNDVASLLRLQSLPDVPVTRQRVLHVHDASPSQMIVVCEAQGSASIQITSSKSSRTLQLSHPCRWEDATTVGDWLVIPTDMGATAIQLTADPPAEIISPPLLERPGMVQLVHDWRGVIAWGPPSATGSARAAARFVNGAWVPLAGEAWPDSLVHLVPLLDGTVLQLRGGPEGTINLAVVPLDQGAVDEKHIAELVAELSNDEPARRERAHQQLMRFGRGAWAVLEKLLPDQPAEGQARIRQILEERMAPTLGGLTPVEGQLQLVWQRNGAAVFFAPQGAQVQTETGEVRLITPAWIAVRPGEPIGLIEEELAALLDPKVDKPCWMGEWIVTGGPMGPRRFIGNRLVPMLRKPDRAYSVPLGCDAAGRWFFRKPEGGPTLVLDPALLDPTPRLPAWNLVAENGQVGWDGNDWPTMKSGGAWRITRDGWEPLKETDALLTVPPAPRPATRSVGRSTTRASTQATRPARQSEPLLTASDGTMYDIGANAIHIEYPDGEKRDWTMPQELHGPLKPLLVEAKGRLFLFNAPGAIHRLIADPAGVEPLRLEVTFTRGIPSPQQILRFWTDPAGRLVIAWDENHLTLLFPDGFVPRSIATKMPLDQLEPVDE